MLFAHLDFKGVSPRAEYLPQLLCDLKALHYDGVLVEYEHVFPFENQQFATDSNEVWSRQQLQGFLDEAARLGLQVVPLQQTLGHLEYVLRWPQFAKMALDRAYPSTLDIARQEPRDWAVSTLAEVLRAHPDSRYVHLGMDEAHALVAYAKTNSLDVVTVFLDYLETLCGECERFDVKPVIWSDMLEDHFSTANLERFKSFADRVVLCSWDYGADGKRVNSARINGPRAAQFWRDNPAATGAPAWQQSTLPVEDLDEMARGIIAPHFDGKTFAPLFWSNIWTSLGFEVWGASASRTSGDGPVLPFYNRHNANVRAWSKAIQSSGASAQVVTSWARGTTFCPPNFSIDASWPVLENAARAESKTPSPFFDGIDEATVTRLFTQLGKCREDWRIEEQIAEEMEELRPRLKAHGFEWESVILLARVLSWQRRLHAALSEVTYFECNDLLPEGEWQRRLKDHAEITGIGKKLHEEVNAHFSQRYFGAAYEEWLRDLFEVLLARLAEYSLACQRNLERSRKRYE